MPRSPELNLKHLCLNSNQSRGKDNTYWYAFLKKGKVFERYIGKHNGGVWEDTYIKGAKSKTMPYGCTIKLIAEKAFLSQTDIKNFNAHYQKLEVKMTNAFHDRFMVLDDKTVYHIGASIKDAGKKCFGITLIQDDTMANDLITGLKKIK